MAPAYDAVVFDNDGVLIEPTDRGRLARAVSDTFAEFDVTVDEARAREMVAAGAVPDGDFEREYGIDPARFWERREAIASEYQRQAIRSGEKALYDDSDAVTALPHRTGLVSNNQHATIEFILDHHDLGRHFETAYGRVPTIEGARRRKPDPSYIEAALDDLGTRSALYVGDSEKDVVAAQRAGIDSAFLRRDHRADLDLSATPTYEVADLYELADRLGVRIE
ncbi:MULTISPECIES: HAD family hydrolase [Halomicrobium]|uniref:HAD-superfamily hydrolase, subfamily IA, variant 1 n=2 Tax=Halomicrobium mukohataei TaxID=57705 RepID=C7P481_HALMD|nr:MULTISPECIES: HAD family hydrolase [Halomicrobium]ACV47903.1 HAD-superfamily hydrolase, subfamily IA, variant 1 [Halomicrobium mukohataei DSM 12286]QCD66342.1 HAD family hydrolase [Halomicrobium mukohataei]QFR21147.1 HAD-IA family hydrolase [Halomicrobium sp. ZPS1]